MTLEFIFAIVTAVVTAILGAILKGGVVPSRFIPLQNLLIGIIAAIVAVYFGLFDDAATAILISVGMSLGAGGAYDLSKTKIKEEE